MQVNTSIFKSRFSVYFSFVSWYLIVSTLLRLALMIWQSADVSWQITDFVRTLVTGFVFDIGSISFVSLAAAIYFALLPNKLIGTWFDKFMCWFFTALLVFILVFSFFAEITFWEEFSTRFNFIAVDYLIYTHEVVANIQESYPLPLLIGGVALITALVLWIFYRRGAFAATFHSSASLSARGLFLICVIATATLCGFFLKNSSAEWSPNRYNSEISKSGVYSFFAAFRNNRMDYSDFYTTIPDADALKIVRQKLSGDNVAFQSGKGVHRTVTDSVASTEKKNVVFILVESLSASFMNRYGNTENLMPFLDSLASRETVFDNFYATGTRTVRGMEAVTLCIPPTPGQSIVKRPDNANLYTVSNVFRKKGYEANFFYGGDGYFDNMNAYFGGNGFNIYDRGSSVLAENIHTKRYHIDDSDVTFENAWGICDEDIFNKMLSVADARYRTNTPFFNFVMTTSNHRPYTYPDGKVDIASGTNRQGAVKYTDYALRQLFKKAARKPWFKNTVFVIVADHCARSAGKDEIDVANYHIPAIVVGMGQHKIEVQCSQIDLFPTLFAMMHWTYESDFFGRSVFSKDFEPRALMGTYRKLTLMKGDRVAILSDQRKQTFSRWKKEDNSLTPLPMDEGFLKEAISWYQTADNLFKNRQLK